MVSDFDDIAMRLKAKLDEKKQEIKDFKAKVKVMLGKVQEEEATKGEIQRNELMSQISLLEKELEEARQHP